ncbi:cysteine-rich receptor-like protein kinase 43 [Aristolochia californica]|uniref:cysteine-rich receptor-like protein kinase 43 n=1 Tax=Aristolochia californica TaxID=171875 RepID=UPI0035DB5ADC
MMTKTAKFLDSLIRPFKSRSERDAQREENLETIAAREQKFIPFEVLVAATQNFDLKNKLGEGGFGPVYKGKLDDGKEIAVKKLSHSSNQGKKQFINEARLLSRVQHRNVVNLLGFCTHGAEKLLVYEYVVHESLDKILFDAKKRHELDWKKRYDVIVSVARGLLYLHEDAHCCIIHRDIKASNILLDDKWVPKIADFGMARLFPEDQTHVNTRVAGTNGYMAPEYVMHGRLSVKADVYSFGVVMLELVTGKKNSAFHLDPHFGSLLEWAWTLYKKGRSLEIMDPTLASSADMDQVALCIQISLLCSQADPSKRPVMRRVVVMLSRKQGIPEEPSRPGMPGNRYRPSNRHHGGLTSSGESSRGATASTSNTMTATNSTATLSPRRPSSTEIRSSDATIAEPTGTTSRSRQSRAREKRPMRSY